MRVISQKSSISVDFDITTFWKNENFIYAIVGDQSKVLGRYESNERADEVFTEMHNARCDEGRMLYLMPDN